MSISKLIGADVGRGLPVGGVALGMMSVLVPMLLLSSAVTMGGDLGGGTENADVDEVVVDDDDDDDDDGTVVVDVIGDVTCEALVSPDTLVVVTADEDDFAEVDEEDEDDEEGNKADWVAVMLWK